MKRQLPCVTIEGTEFCVDVMREELFEKANQKNRISFNVFSQEGNGYTFLYDRTRKNVPENGETIEKLEESFVWVTLPALMELDPEGIALKYDIPLSVLYPEKAASLLTEDEEGGDLW